MRLKRPDRLKGTPEQQTEQLRAYLQGLVNDLEIKLDEVDRRLIGQDKRIKEVEKK